MKVHHSLIAGVILPASLVLTWRHLEWNELRDRAETLRKAGLPGSGAQADRLGSGGEWDAAPLLASFDEACRSQTPAREGYAAFLHQLAGLSPKQLLALLKTAQSRKEVSPEFFPILARFVLPEIAEKDPMLAASTALELGETYPEILRMVELLAMSWMEKDPGKCADWLSAALDDGKLREPPMHDQLRNLAALGRVMAEPLSSFDFIRTQPEEMRRSLLGNAASRLKSTADARAFVTAALALPESDSASPSVEAGMKQLGKMESFAALSAWLDAMTGAPPAQKSRARLALALQAPDAVEAARRADWVMASGDAGTHRGLSAKLVEAWAAKDCDAAGTWLNARRTADWYDSAVKAYAAGIAGKEPATAFDWAVTIGDESLRHEALSSVMTRWRKDNAGEALAYLAAAPLPEEWKAELSR